MKEQEPPLLARCLRFCLAVLCALALATTLALAQQTQQAPQAPQAAKASRTLDQVRADLDTIRKEVALPTISPGQLAEKRKAAETIRIEALAAQAEIRKPLADFTAQLTKLGDPPGEGQSEAPAVADARKRLSETLALLEGASKQLGVVAVEADQVASTAANLERDLFISRVFEPSRSLLNLVAWYDLLASLPTFAQRTGALLTRALTADPTVARAFSPTASYLTAVAIALAALLIVWGFNLRLMRRGQTIQPDHLQRLWRVVWVTVLTMGLLAGGFLAAHLVANLTGGIGPRLTRVTVAAEQGFLWLAGTLAFAWGVLAPRNPAWRLVDLDDHAVRAMAWTITVIAFVFSADHVVSTMADVLFLPIEFTVGWSAGVAVLLVIPIAMLLRTARDGADLAATPESGRQYYFGWTGYLLHLLWLVVVVSALALFFGYVAFAHFLLTKLTETAVLVSLLYLLHHLADAVVSASLDTRTAPGRFVRTTLALGEAGARRLGLFFSTLVDLALILGGVPLVLAQWALTWIDYSSWVETIFFGFKVGDITIEPAAILLAIAMLAVGLIAARLFTLWLDKRLLARTQIDSGVRNSLLTGASYASVLLAAAIAVTAAGADFSNFAIIAGALSVGIGFGLQSIVNNFVSGLILLAERPIRVGDWIAVTGGEGTVKKINVRSTEIETFDRGSVIIPNSSLISEAVLNWTHADSIGRVRVAVGVSYDADPGQVEKILLECARANKRVLTFPQPFVLFMNFGASSLDFELRVYIPDVNYVATVGSELRFAIHKALKEAGIEIPYPQRDVHVKSLPQAPAPQPRPAARKPRP